MPTTVRGRIRHGAAGALSRSTHSGSYVPLDGGEPRQGMDSGAMVWENLGYPWYEAQDGMQVQAPGIGAGAVDGGSHILPFSLDDISLFADTIRPPVVVDDLPALPDDLFPMGSFVFWTVDSKLYRNTDGASWTALTDGADIVSGSITAGQIAAGAIGADELAANSVTAGKIAAGAVSATNIDAGGISANQIMTGTLEIGGLGHPDYIVIYDPTGTIEIGRWDVAGLTIKDTSNPNLQLRLMNGVLEFSGDGGSIWNTAISYEGIWADSIRLGTAPGGHNAVPNSSFELSSFLSPLTKVWTTTVEWDTTIGTDVNAQGVGASLVLTTAAY